MAAVKLPTAPEPARVKRKKEAPRFDKEADLCAAFIEWVKHYGWTAYNETEGWDILLVNPQGVQLGVQAKLKLNTKVLTQVLPGLHAWRDEGPDYRAILIGEERDDSAQVCNVLGVGCFSPVDERFYHRQREAPLSFYQQPPDASGDIFYSLSGSCGRFPVPWHDWHPAARHKLPDYIPDVIAGDSGPVQLTPWKIGALKVIALLELRGYVTREDFKTFGVSHYRWTGPGDWLQKAATAGHYLRGPGLPDFKDQHPRVYAEIRADLLSSLGGLDLSGVAPAPDPDAIAEPDPRQMGLAL